MVGKYGDGRTREGKAVNSVSGLGCGCLPLGIILFIALFFFVNSDSYDAFRDFLKEQLRGY